MSNEAQISSSLRILKGNLQYQSIPTSFRADVTGTKGPTPGSIAVSTAGTDVDLSELSTPGLCRLRNLDSANYVTWGIYDGAYFFPLGEILAGESYVIRLSRVLGSESPGTAGTGAGNRLRVMADTADCVVAVEAFEA